MQGSAVALNFLGAHIMCPPCPRCPEVVCPMGAPTLFPRDQVRLERALLGSKCLPFSGASLPPLGREPLLGASPFRGHTVNPSAHALRKEAQSLPPGDRRGFSPAGSGARARLPLTAGGSCDAGLVRCCVQCWFPGAHGQEPGSFGLQRDRWASGQGQLGRGRCLRETALLWQLILI